MTICLFITADHGNDPTYEGTDHTREQVPVLMFGRQVAPPQSRTTRHLCRPRSKHCRLFGHCSARLRQKLFEMSWNAPNLPADKHRFFDRHGGVSNGRYESLNVNRKSADAPENIRQNINIAAGAFGMTAAAAAFPVRA